MTTNADDRKTANGLVAFLNELLIAFDVGQAKLFYGGQGGTLG